MLVSLSAWEDGDLDHQSWRCHVRNETSKWDGREVPCLEVGRSPLIAKIVADVEDSRSRSYHAIAQKT